MVCLTHACISSILRNRLKKYFHRVCVRKPKVRKVLQKKCTVYILSGTVYRITVLDAEAQVQD